jgi:hypothetical protein
MYFLIKLAEPIIFIIIYFFNFIVLMLFLFFSFSCSEGGELYLEPARGSAHLQSTHSALFTTIRYNWTFFVSTS